jgi:hypothetical protein
MAVAYSTIIHHLLDSLGMKSFHLPWVLRELTPSLRVQQFEICGQLLPILEARELDSFRMLVIIDETGFVLESQYSTKWSVAGDEIRIRVSHTDEKVTLTLVWGIGGFDVVDMMPPEGAMTLSASLLILWILCWRKSFQREGKIMHFD